MEKTVLTNLVTDQIEELQKNLELLGEVIQELEIRFESVLRSAAEPAEQCDAPFDGPHGAVNPNPHSSLVESLRTSIVTFQRHRESLKSIIHRCEL